MTMNPLPPQAYTKETMLKAYQWLMGQSSSIKEMATTPDILVSLYLKTTRDGSAALDRPSIQNFKNELRSLAGMMGELDRPPVATPTPVMMPQSTVMVQPPTPPMPPAPAPMPVQNQTQVSYTEKTLTATTRNHDVLDVLDLSTRDMIQEVKEEFNLSSDLEALRMLVKIGYGRAKGLAR